MTCYLVARRWRSTSTTRSPRGARRRGHPAATRPPSGWPRRLLAEPVRDHVRNVYALVRLADEIVDGPTPARAASRGRAMLDRLEDETCATAADGLQHQPRRARLRRTAPPCGIGDDLVDALLRLDAHRPRDHGTPASLRALRLRLGRGRRAHVPAGLPGRTATAAHARRGRATTSSPRAPASLGAAFQKVNFLRDLAEDHGTSAAATSRARPRPALPRPTAPPPRRHRRRPRGGRGGRCPTCPDSRRAVRAAHALVRRAARRLARRRPAAEIAQRPGPRAVTSARRPASRSGACSSRDRLTP